MAKYPYTCTLYYILRFLYLYLCYFANYLKIVRVIPLCPFLLISTFTKNMIELGKMKKKTCEL